MSECSAPLQLAKADTSRLDAAAGRTRRKQKLWLVDSLLPSQPPLSAYRALLLPMPQQLASSKPRKTSSLSCGHSDKDSGQISARGIKEYDLNLKLAGRVLEELVNTGFVSTQMIVTSGPNTHESRLRRSKRANDLGADLFISVHHDGVKNETLMPWQYNG
jgi:N-acetylmuramoyl-L-alanine amidase